MNRCSPAKIVRSFDRGIVSIFVTDRDDAQVIQAVKEVLPTAVREE